MTNNFLELRRQKYFEISSQIARLDDAKIHSLLNRVIKYRSIIALMQDFFAEMWENNQKNTLFPHAKLRLLLNKTGFLPIQPPHCPVCLE